jgi:hypothetical protein
LDNLQDFTIENGASHGFTSGTWDMGMDQSSALGVFTCGEVGQTSRRFMFIVFFSRLLDFLALKLGFK